MFLFSKNKVEKRKVLILQGGGMRGIFNTGVLQAFSERNYFPWKMIAGSSAGALTAVVYATKQIYIARDIFFTELMSDRFIKLRNILRSENHILDLDWLIARVLNGKDPLNIKKLKKACPVIITATNIPEKGKPETIYLNSKKDDITKALTATAALPFLYRGLVKYKNYNLLDGALIEPIPYRHIKKLGIKDKDITIILTRSKGYRKYTESFWINAILEYHYRDNRYNELINLLYNRYQRYNKYMDELENNHPEIRFIYPTEKFRVSRLTQDLDLLMEGFQEGIQAARDYLDEINFNY